MSMDGKQEVEKLSAEQAADLAALQGAAGDGQQQPGAVPGPVVQFDLAGDIAAMIAAAVAILGKPLPSLVEIYTPETTAAAAEAVARVCHKRGWLSEGFGPYSEEIAAVMILGPLAWSTYAGVNGDIARAKALHDARAGVIDGAKVPSGSPGADTVIVGAPLPAGAA